MRYDALTLDTQTIESYGFRFDSGILAQLKQFRSAPTTVVMSSIVIQEIAQRLTEKTREAGDNLDAAIKKAREYNIPTPEYQEKHGDNWAKDLTKKRMSKFFSEIGSETITLDNVSLRDIFKLYFLSLPPFSASGKKKNEFPDAAALLSLEQWAQKNNKMILAVTKDKDWMAYAKKSITIDVIDDLPKALELLQQHAKEAADIAQRLLAKICQFKISDPSNEFCTLLENEVSGLTVWVEAQSRFDTEPTEAELDFLDYSFQGSPEEYEFTVVRAGPGTIVVQVPINIEVIARATFSLSIHDSIDGNDFNIGSANAERRAFINGIALITFDGPFSDLDKVEISSVELVDTKNEIDFGYVEPDWGDEYFEE